MQVKEIIKGLFRRFGYNIIKDNGLIIKPTDVNGIDILKDPDFQRSVKEVEHLTLLDTDRLANLWQLRRTANPDGASIEIGSYRGGGALHISNAAPTRPIYVCDTFEGFGDLPFDKHLDQNFTKTQFDDNSFAKVKASWAHKDRDVRWVRGYFPQSAKGMEIDNISFAHIDVDLYKSTADTFQYLRPRFTKNSIIVLDDFARGTDGVVKAVREFREICSDWAAFPIFPGQGIMVHRSWFD